LRTRVEINDIRLLSSRSIKRKRQSKTTFPQHRRTTHIPKNKSNPNSTNEGFSVIPSNQNSCDLRGMRVEEALDKVESFLDQAMREERNAVLLIHGHGTGILREAVRKHCKDSPYIQRFRAGESSEGGNGVTAVLIK